MSEFTKQTRVTAGALALTLGLAACSSDKPDKAPSKHVTTITNAAGHKEVIATSTLPKVQVRYYSPGYRELIFSAINRNGGISGSEHEGYSDVSTMVTDVLQMCDNGDLVEQTEAWVQNRYSDNVSASNDWSRTPNYPACADGMLTPSDFSAHPSKVETH